ncbi:kinase-like domain-containing protein [Hypoxylon sp. FL1857]|nr:kinase-like domain-containing protein [Hypoxylon sp. FL1857]
MNRSTTREYPEGPHPLSLFSLVPNNQQAQEVMRNSYNAHLVSKHSDGVLALDIGHVLSRNPRTTLATLGRQSDSDIVVEFDYISRNQCSFEINPASEEIALEDNSGRRTTRVARPGTADFTPIPQDGVDIWQDQNIIFMMGVMEPQCVKFQIRWPQDRQATMIRIQNRQSTSTSRGYIENPRRAVTPRPESIGYTIWPSQVDGRRGRNRPIEYNVISRVGSGAFGRVLKINDKSNGRIMAVKILRKGQNMNRALREVDTLKALNHPNIIKYIASQGWNGGLVEIFMHLQEGNLPDLLRNKSADEHLVASFLKQMLMALDYLAIKNVIHRDIKPENILFISNPKGGYNFQLADFGLCHNDPLTATTLAGTWAYMAPEVGRGDQSPKLDVWSLFMTMVWIYDVDGFRSKVSELTREECYPIWKQATEYDLREYRKMGEYFPGPRASAAQMLVKFCSLDEEDGLSTPRADILPLLDNWIGWPRNW